MKKNRFSEEQIIGILKQHEAGVKTVDLCREHGISAATFYAWKSKYGGMDAVYAGCHDAGAIKLCAARQRLVRLRGLAAKTIALGQLRPGEKFSETSLPV